MRKRFHRAFRFLRGAEVMFEEGEAVKIVRRAPGERRRKSPRPHLRLHHWKRVPVGKGRAGRKLTLISETEVMADGD